MDINPEEDGITHINCYSKGKTVLGRFLSNFAKAPFKTEEGAFESIEGYWYYLGTYHIDRYKLKNLSGFDAKSWGKKMKEECPSVNCPDFEEKIFKAICAKINNNKEMKELLLESSLPLVHYYNYGGALRFTPQHDWIWKRIQTRRDEYKRINND